MSKNRASCATFRAADGNASFLPTTCIYGGNHCQHGGLETLESPVMSFACSRCRTHALGGRAAAMGAWPPATGTPFLFSSLQLSTH